MKNSGVFVAALALEMCTYLINLKIIICAILVNSTEEQNNTYYVLDLLGFYDVYLDFPEKNSREIGVAFTLPGVLFEFNENKTASDYVQFFVKNNK